jgi:hypothetical protein
MKLVVTLVALALAIALGIAALVAGQADDSPGLGGIGLLLIIGAVVVGVRRVRRGRRTKPGL